MNRQNEGKCEKAIIELHKATGDFYVCEREALGDFLRNVIDDFGDNPGGSTHHHGYRYGLLIHTAEVVKMARQMMMGNTLVVTAAAIMHDWGKIYDYEITRKRYSKEISPGVYSLSLNYRDEVKRRPGFQKAAHIIASYDRWQSVRETVDLDTSFRIAVGKCILSHHGQLEWGSVLTPSTPEEWCLHLADMASANAGVLL